MLNIACAIERHDIVSPQALSHEEGTDWNREENAKASSLSLERFRLFETN